MNFLHQNRFNEFSAYMTLKIIGYFLLFDIYREFLKDIAYLSAELSVLWGTQGI